MTDADQGFAYEFGDWLIEPDLNRIRRGEQEIQLEPSTLGVLCYLLERPGEIVSVDELLASVWQDDRVEARFMVEYTKLLDSYLEGFEPQVEL